MYGPFCMWGGGIFPSSIDCLPTFGERWTCAFLAVCACARVSACANCGACDESLNMHDRAQDETRKSACYSSHRIVSSRRRQGGESFVCEREGRRRRRGGGGGGV